MKYIKMLDGYKTYIFATLAVAIEIANIYGLLDAQMYQTIMMIDIGLLGGSIRHALSKLEK